MNGALNVFYRNRLHLGETLESVDIMLEFTLKKNRSVYFKICAKWCFHCSTFIIMRPTT